MALTDHTSDVEIKLLDLITGQEACSMFCDKLLACLPSKEKGKGGRGKETRRSHVCVWFRCHTRQEKEEKRLPLLKTGLSLI